jgi:hypothetical protein
MCNEKEREKQIQNLQGGLAGWRLRKEQMLQFTTKDHLLQNSLVCGQVRLFVLFMPSTDWMRPAYTVEGNLLFSKFTTFHVNLLQ